MQNKHEYVHILVTKKWIKIGILYLVNNRVNGHIFRAKISFISFLAPILGHPVYQFLQKPEFSDFTASGSRLP